jgi:hypothetical protein
MVGIGESAFAFIDDYVAFLIAYDLARIDFDAWRRTETVLQMVGKFVCPLTERGRALVEHISQLDREMGGQVGYRTVVMESFVEMVKRGIDDRVERIEEFKKKTFPDPTAGTE